MKLVQGILSFYVEGFSKMKLGRTLWTVILIKLFIIFGVLKFSFFPNYLNANYATDQEKATHVLENITRFPSPTQQKGGSHVRTN